MLHLDALFLLDGICGSFLLLRVNLPMKIPPQRVKLPSQLKACPHSVIAGKSRDRGLVQAPSRLTSSPRHMGLQGYGGNLLRKSAKSRTHVTTGMVMCRPQEELPSSL